MGAQLSSRAFSIPVRVYYQDTDVGGVVFHGAYLNFLERGRVEWLRERGFDPQAMSGDLRCLFIVRRLQIAYRRPALLDDLLQVTTEVLRLGRAQLTFLQQVCRGTELLAEASVNLACVSANDLRPSAIPQEIRERCIDGEIGAAPQVINRR